MGIMSRGGICLPVTPEAKVVSLLMGQTQPVKKEIVNLHDKIQSFLPVEFNVHHLKIK